MLDKYSFKYIYIYILILNIQLYFLTFKYMLLKIWYQIHFIYYEYFQYVFSQHFLNYNFYIILNNNTSKPIPNMLKVVNPFYLAKINNCEPFLFI